MDTKGCAVFVFSITLGASLYESPALQRVKASPLEGLTGNDLSGS